MRSLFHNQHKTNYKNTTPSSKTHCLLHIFIRGKASQVVPPHWSIQFFQLSDSLEYLSLAALLHLTAENELVQYIVHLQCCDSERSEKMQKGASVKNNVGTRNRQYGKKRVKEKIYRTSCNRDIITGNRRCRAILVYFNSCCFYAIYKYKQHEACVNKLHVLLVISSCLAGVLHFCKRYIFHFHSRDMLSQIASKDDVRHALQGAE